MINLFIELRDALRDIVNHPENGLDACDDVFSASVEALDRANRAIDFGKSDTGRALVDQAAKMYRKGVTQGAAMVEATPQVLVSPGGHWVQGWLWVPSRPPVPEDCENIVD